MAMTTVTVESDTVSAKRLLSGAELFQSGDSGRAELVKGEIISMPPTGYLHGQIEVKLVTLLSRFVDERKLGRVLAGEVGIYTRRDPDTVRGVDVAYISHERLKQVQSNSYLDIPPDLIVEILSPGDRWSDVMEKLEEYFAIGTLMVWLVDPRRRKVQVFHSITQSEQLDEGEQLTGGQVLAGFAVTVVELFT